MDIYAVLNYLRETGWTQEFQIGKKDQYSRTWGDYKVVQAECGDYIMLVCWGRKLIWLTDVLLVWHRSSWDFLESRLVDV